MKIKKGNDLIVRKLPKCEYDNIDDTFCGKDAVAILTEDDDQSPIGGEFCEEHISIIKEEYKHICGRFKIVYYILKEKQ